MSFTAIRILALVSLAPMLLAQVSAATPSSSIEDPLRKIPASKLRLDVKKDSLKALNGTIETELTGSLPVFGKLSSGVSQRWKPDSLTGSYFSQNLDQKIIASGGWSLANTSVTGATELDLHKDFFTTSSSLSTDKGATLLITGSNPVMCAVDAKQPTIWRCTMSPTKTATPLTPPSLP